MATLLKAVKAIAAFPAADVEACIRDALQEQSDTQSDTASTFTWRGARRPGMGA